MNLQNKSVNSDIILLVDFESFNDDISKIDINDVYVGTRYEINDEFFQDYDSIIYSLNPKSVIFIKIRYQDDFICFHDILDNIDAPILGSSLDNTFAGIARYKIHPKYKLTDIIGNDKTLEEAIDEFKSREESHQRKRKI